MTKHPAPCHVSRAERRRAARAEAKRRTQAPDPDVLVIVGFWPEDEIEEAKKATHDAVIEALGARRRSGVQWVIVRGAEATAFLDRLMEGAGPDHRAYYRRLRACVRDYPDGVVVAATAEGDRA